MSEQAMSDQTGGPSRSSRHNGRSGGALPGLLKGLATTAKTLGRPTHTTEYPDAPPHLPPRSRGVIALLEENCTSCMLCARECPDWCIYIDSHKETIPATTPGGRERQRNVLDRFAIDFSLCMYCGICIEVCPFDALHWSPEFEYSELDIRDLLHEKDRLGQWMPTVPPPPALDPGSAEPAEVAAANKPARPTRAGGAPTTARPARPERPERPAAAERPARAERPSTTVRAPRSDAEAAAAAQQAAEGEGVGPQTTPHSPPPSERPADSVPAEPPTRSSPGTESGSAETKSPETPRDAERGEEE